MKAKRLAVLAACVLGAGMLAGTALGVTSTWQDVWAQIKPLLSDPGTINSADNPVHWTKLKGVPAGLADGVDNGVDRAGFGLKKNVFPHVEFAVDPSTIQRRVTGTCEAGQAIQSIGADGTTACAFGEPVVYHGWDSADDAPLFVNYTTIGGELAVPAGSWAVDARLELTGSGLYCRLEARTDAGFARLDFSWTDSRNVSLEGVHTSTTPWRAAVSCKKLSPDERSWWTIQLHVTKVGELHSEQLRP